MNRVDCSIAISQFRERDNWRHDNTDLKILQPRPSGVRLRKRLAGQDSLEEFCELLGWMHSRVIWRAAVSKSE